VLGKEPEVLVQIVAIAADGTRRNVLVDLNAAPDAVRAAVAFELGESPVRVELPAREVRHDGGIRGLNRLTRSVFS
jgi:hypothetical protein